MLIGKRANNNLSKSTKRDSIIATFIERNIPSLTGATESSHTHQRYIELKETEKKMLKLFCSMKSRKVESQK